MPQPPPSEFQRFETRRARQRLAEQLDLPNDDLMQDWSVEVADSARIEEFLDHYEEAILDEDDRYVLMNLVIASIEDALVERGAALGWERAPRLLRRDWDIHAYAIWYWSAWSHELEDTPFAVSRRMRDVWREVEPELALE